MSGRTFDSGPCGGRPGLIAGKPGSHRIDAASKVGEAPVGAGLPAIGPVDPAQKLRRIDEQEFKAGKK
ncbi:hypothetical protein D3C81_2240040 [compost metagenome]